MMSENEDPGKALLRLLQGHASPVSPMPTEHQNTQIPEFHSLLPLPAADVRIAAAGGYSEPHIPRFDYHIPHPESSMPSISRLAGEDLLRMLHQGGSPTPTSTTVFSTSHQPVPPPPPATVPSVSMSRSVAAEHERRLRNLLSIGEGDSSSFLGPSHSEGIAQPSLSLAAPPVAPMTPLTPRSVAPPVVTASSTTVTDGAAFGNPKKKKRARNNKGRNKSGKYAQQAETSDRTGGNSQGFGNSRGKATGASGKSTASRQDGERKLSTGSGGERPGRSRGGRGRGHGGGTNGSKPAYEGGKSGKGSGRSTRGPRGAASPQGQSFAWSAFQNSPDPKNIPIPPLQHFLLNPEVSEDSQQVERSPSPGWHNTSMTAQGDSSVLAPQELLLHTPPPPPRDLRVRPDERTSAQKVEDDIKRILRLN